MNRLPTDCSRCQTWGNNNVAQCILSFFLNKISIPSKQDVCILLWYNVSLYKERSDVLRYFPRDGKFNTLRSQPPLTHPFSSPEEATPVLATNRPTKFLESQPDFRSFLFPPPPVAFQFPTFCRDQIKSSTKLSPRIFFVVLCHQRSSFFKPLPPSSFFRYFFFFFDTVLLRKSFHSLKLGSNVWSDRTRVYTRDYYFLNKCCDNVVIIGAWSNWNKKRIYALM